MNTNSTVLETQLNAVREQISGSLEKHKHRGIHSNSVYTTANIILSALAALWLVWQELLAMPKIEGGLSTCGWLLCRGYL